MTNGTRQSVISGAFLIGSIILTYFLTTGNNTPSYVGGDNVGRDSIHLENPTYIQPYIEKYEDKRQKSDIQIGGDFHGDINMNDGDVINQVNPK